MKSFSFALQKTLRSQASSDVLAAKAARAAQVKRMWKSAVEACAGAAAPVILDHTNSIYIIRNHETEQNVSRETSTRQATPMARNASGRHQLLPGELIVYVEDSLIAAEIDARREMIKLKFLELFGEEIDEFRIRVSRGKYKLDHPYREQTASAASTKAPRQPLSKERIAQIDEELSEIPNERVREALKRAMISDLEVKNAAEGQNGDDRAL